MLKPMTRQIFRNRIFRSRHILDIWWTLSGKLSGQYPAIRRTTHGEPVCTERRFTHFTVRYPAAYIYILICVMGGKSCWKSSLVSSIWQLTSIFGIIWEIDDDVLRTSDLYLRVPVWKVITFRVPSETYLLTKVLLEQDFSIPHSSTCTSR